MVEYDALRARRGPPAAVRARTRGRDAHSVAMDAVHLLVVADGQAAGRGCPVRELSGAGVRGHGGPHEGARRQGRTRLCPLRLDPLLGAAHPASSRQGADGEGRPRLLDRIRTASQTGCETPAKAASIPADAYGVPSQPVPEADVPAEDDSQFLVAG